MRPVYSVILFFVLIMCVCCENIIPHNRLESHVLLLLEKWRMGNLYSHILPLPPLKSFMIPDVEYSYDRKGIKMTYALNTIQLTGLDNFSVKQLVVYEDKGNLEIFISINVPKLTLYADSYELQGRAYLLYPLKGSGNMTVIFRDSDLTFKIRFATLEDGISTRIKEFLFDFNVDQIEANLVDSSWPINKVLNSDGVEILESYHDEIVQAMWDYVVPFVDEHLVNVSTAQMVNVLESTNYD